MKKLLSLFLITFCLSSCAYLMPHKREIEQGNIYSDSQVLALRHGMTEREVKHLMGEPIMTNIFTPTEMTYVYTIQRSGQNRKEKQVVCTFHHGRLSTVSTGA